MDRRRFAPGFRFSRFDGFILLMGMTAMAFILRMNSEWTFMIGLPLVHFFLFCSEVEFLNLRNTAQKHDSSINSRKGNLEDLKDFLLKRKAFLLDLIQNQNMLQNEPFSNLVWAVFHLAKELEHRQDLKSQPDTDYEHLSEDIRRVYQLLLVQWMDYLKHLKTDYPYLFSLASRTNPFDRSASVEVK